MSSRQEVPGAVHLTRTDSLSAEGTVHVTRVLLAGGTVRLTEEIVAVINIYNISAE
jgi:hypothetical protein